MSAVREIDFPVWGITSGVFWISSCVTGIASAFYANKDSAWEFAVVISLLGIAASIAGIFSITGIWHLVRVRHRFFEALGRRFDYQERYKALLGISIRRDSDKNTLILDSSRLIENYRDEINSFKYTPDVSDVWNFTLLNVLAYADNVFGQSPKKKFERNLRLYNKNKYCQLLLRRFSTEKYWGLSAIFPMTNKMVEAYLSEQQSDNDFRSSLVISEANTDNHELDCMLIFSIGAVQLEPLGFFKRRKSNSMAAGLMVLIGVFYQIYTLTDHYRRNRSIPEGDEMKFDLIVSANDPAVINVFQSFGFFETGQSTGDDIPLLRAHMELHL
jgi:hypothetical protein